MLPPLTLLDVPPSSEYYGEEYPMDDPHCSGLLPHDVVPGCTFNARPRLTFPSHPTSPPPDIDASPDEFGDDPTEAYFYTPTVIHDIFVYASSAIPEAYFSAVAKGDLIEADRLSELYHSMFLPPDHPKLQFDPPQPPPQELPSQYEPPPPAPTFEPSFWNEETSVMAEPYFAEFTTGIVDEDCFPSYLSPPHHAPTPYAPTPYMEEFHDPVDSFQGTVPSLYMFPTPTTSPSCSFDTRMQQGSSSTPDMQLMQLVESPLPDPPRGKRKKSRKTNVYKSTPASLSSRKSGPSSRGGKMRCSEKGCETLISGAYERRRHIRTVHVKQEATDFLKASHAQQMDLEYIQSHFSNLLQAAIPDGDSRMNIEPLMAKKKLLGVSATLVLQSCPNCGTPVGARQDSMIRHQNSSKCRLMALAKSAS